MEWAGPAVAARGPPPPGYISAMRKPPELLVMLAPAALVTAVVVAFGFMLGGEPQQEAAADPTPGTSVSAPQPQGGQVEDAVGASPAPLEVDGAPFLVAPPTVLEPKPRPKFRLLDSYSFTIGSFNILGASHSASGGRHAKFAPAGVRMTWTLGLLSGQSIDIVGLQELQPTQYNDLLSRAGGTWDLWPGMAYGRDGVANSLAWNQGLFRAVAKETIDIPYFGGRLRPMPYVLLEHIATGQKLWVANFHNPADAHGPAARFRAAARARQIALANRLAATGYPVFFTGDFNDREEYFCPVTMNTELKSASGGSTGSPCVPPARMNVDWIFGSDAITFGGYRVIDNRASDHPLIVSGVTVPEDRERIEYRNKR